MEKIQLKQNGSIRLNVPFFRQHYDVTCGPVSLMMAMKYFSDISLTKDLEIDIWREGNMVEVYGTSRYGLAYSATIRGFCSKVTSNTGGIDFVDRLIPPVKDLDLQVLNLHFKERRNRCRKLGVKEKRLMITKKLVYNALLSGHIPLLVTNALYCKGENLPHWITVTGMDNKFIYFNNPLDVKSRERKFELSGFQDFVGYRGDQSMVEVWKRK